MTTNDGQRRHDDNGGSKPVPSAPKVTLCGTYENNRMTLLAIILMPMPA